MAGFDDLAPADKVPAGKPVGTGFEDVQPSVSQPDVSRLERFGRGLLDPIEGGAQLLYNALPKGAVEAGNKVNNMLAKYGLVAPVSEEGLNTDIRAREAEYQARRGDEAGSADWYRVGGNVAGSLIPGAAGVKGVQAASLAGRLGVGAAGGAAGAAFNPVYGADEDYWGEKGKQAATGAAFGAAVPAVTAAAGRVISPNASRNADLALLQAQGVRPTIGQALGGAANRIEERTMSTPIAGDFIINARRQAAEDFNRAAIDRVRGPLGLPRLGNTAPIGNEAVREVGDRASALYQRADNTLGNFRLDPQWDAELANLRSMASNMGAKERRQFNTAVNEISSDISPQGFVFPDHFKRIDSYLQNQARSFSGSNDAYQQNLGAGFDALRTSFRDAARRQNPQAEGMYQQADRAWANLVRVEGAAKTAKMTEGVFTPGQLLGAIQTADKSTRKRAVARGEALMQDLGTAGQNVLGNKVPNSGTAERIGNMAMIYQLATSPTKLAATALAPIAYSNLGQRALVGAVASRPQIAHQAAPWLLRRSTKLSPGAGLLGPRAGTDEENQYID